MSQTRISRDDVRRIARLARLSLSGDEIEIMTRELQSIVEHFARIEDLELSPTQLERLDLPSEFTDPSQARCANRTDETEPSSSAETITERAPAFTQAHFIVPRIIG